MTGRTLRSAAREQSGAVLVFVALCMPVFIGFTGLVLDVGNWFAHKRHLQLQADAGALAGAGVAAKMLAGCDDATVQAEISKYSSVADGGNGLNPQIGDTPPDELHQLLNSPTFYDQSTPVDDTVSACPARQMIDVKLTETNLPWWLRIAQVPYINAHARVEFKKKTTSQAALPVGVPEVGPQKVKALFVDESSGTVVASTNLTRRGTNNGLAIWDNQDVPVPVTVNASKIGVRIALSGSSSTNCGDPLVNCYGAGTNAAIVAGSPGLAHIRGWSTSPTGTATAPQARTVNLTGSSCEDGYFTATASADPCTVNVSATIDFGATIPAGTRVWAMRTGANNNTAVLMTPPGTPGGTWTGGTVPVNRGEGAVSVDLRWGVGCSNDNPGGNTCSSKGNITVQRAFAGSESLTVSGPIKLLRLSESGVPGANSYQRCSTCTHNLVVTLGLKPSLQNASSITDPVVSLKVAGGGSQNQALDCDPNLSNLRDELHYGCGPTYAVNTGTVCPGGAQALWGTAQPWNCVVINTGTTVGQVTQGLNERILGDANPSSCTAPNNWSSFPDLPAGDPRIVEVFLAPFGAFSGSGGTTVPVTGFATFYVTGWHNGGCQGAGDDPAGQGEVVGHYIKYIDTLGNGGGEEFCDFDALGSCVAVFTR